MHDALSDGVGQNAGPYAVHRGFGVATVHHAGGHGEVGGVIPLGTRDAARVELGEEFGVGGWTFEVRRHFFRV